MVGGACALNAGAGIGALAGAPVGVTSALLGGALGAAGVGVWGALQRRVLRDAGVYRARRDEHPALWAFCQDIADRVGTPPVTGIVVTPECDVRVVAGEATFGLELGFPVLVGASVGELRAIVAHTVAHHATGVAGGRQAEAAADARAAQIAGAGHAVEALSLMPAVAGAWGALLRDYVPLADEAGRTPRRADGLVRLLVANAGREGEARGRCPWLDDHPVTPERFASLADLVRVAPVAGDAPERDDRPASALLAGGDDVWGRVEARLWPGRAPRGEWDDIAAAAGTARLRAAGPGARDVMGIPALEATGGVGDVLDALARRPTGPHAPDPALLDAAEALLIAALIETGDARVRVAWLHGPVFYAGRDDLPLDLRHEIALAVTDPRLLDPLRAAIRDAAGRVPATGAQAVAAAGGAWRLPSPDVPFAGVLTRVAHGAGDDIVDVAVSYDRLLLAPVDGDWPDERTRLRASYGAGARRRPAGVWVWQHAIDAADLLRTGVAWTLTLHLDDGGRCVLRDTPATVGYGRPHAAIVEMLGDRLRVLDPGGVGAG